MGAFLGVSFFVVVSIFRLSWFSFYGQPISFGREQIYQLLFDGMGRQPGAATVACGMLIVLILPINGWQWNGQNYCFHGESSDGFGLAVNWSRSLAGWRQGAPFSKMGCPFSKVLPPKELGIVFEKD
jgi:hypothetical protein